MARARCVPVLRGAGRRAIVSEMSMRWNLLPRFARDRLLVCFQALRGRGSGPPVLVAAGWEISTAAPLARRLRIVGSERRQPPLFGLLAATSHARISMVRTYVEHLPVLQPNADPVLFVLAKRC